MAGSQLPACPVHCSPSGEKSAVASEARAAEPWTNGKQQERADSLLLQGSLHPRSVPCLVQPPPGLGPVEPASPAAPPLPPPLNGKEASRPTCSAERRAIFAACRHMRPAAVAVFDASRLGPGSQLALLTERTMEPARPATASTPRNKASAVSRVEGMATACSSPFSSPFWLASRAAGSAAEARLERDSAPFPRWATTASKRKLTPEQRTLHAAEVALVATPPGPSAAADAEKAGARSENCPAQTSAQVSSDTSRYEAPAPPAGDGCLTCMAPLPPPAPLPA